MCSRVRSRRPRCTRRGTPGTRRSGISGFRRFPTRALGDRIEEEEEGRKAVDGFWVGTFILTLFAIHVGRMGFRTAPRWGLCRRDLPCWVT